MRLSYSFLDGLNDEIIARKEWLELILSPEQLKETMLGKADDELYATLYIHSNEYTPEAINAARAEFDRRQLAAPTANTVAADIERVQQQQQTPLSVPLRVVAFLVSSGILLHPCAFGA